jgi:hypothetical protein
MANYKLLDFEIFGDNKSSLTSIESGRNVPFEIKRVYYIFNTKIEVERGFHAHLNLKQVVISVKGSCEFILDDGIKRINIKLDKPNIGLFLEGMIWREMKNFSSDCVLLVLASEHYNADDYLRNYQKFLQLVHNDT